MQGRTEYLRLRDARIGARRQCRRKTTGNAVVDSAVRVVQRDTKAAYKSCPFQEVQS